MRSAAAVTRRTIDRASCLRSWQAVAPALALAVVVACVGGARLPAAQTPKRPNILLIFTDDQSYRTVGCYEGAPSWVRTPNTDRLAAEGVRFTAAYAGTWCLPSRAMLLTGLQPHGIRGMKFRNNPDGEYDPRVCRFWPAEFRKGGYRTGMIGKWHLSPDTGHGRDWDDSVIWNHAVRKQPGGYYVDQSLNFNGGPFTKVDGYSTDNYTRYAVDFVKESRGRPWFLWLCYGAVHSPYICAERHRQDYLNEPVETPSDIFPPRPGKPAYNAGFSVWTRGPDGKPRDAKGVALDEGVRQYNRCVRAIDEGVGTLMKALEDTGQLDNTLVVFTSDQGFAWGQHGYETKVAPYDDNLRVPFIVRMPSRFASRKVCRSPVLAIDLVPTFFALAGLPLPWTMHGHDLSPLLKHPDAAWDHPAQLGFFRWEFGEETDAGHSSVPFQSIPWWVFLREGRYKYIRTLVDHEIEELYDLDRDPHELHNLALEREFQPTLASFRRRLTDELHRTQAGFADNLPAAAGGRQSRRAGEP
jgi:arylsulfatase A-like enzyme